MYNGEHDKFWTPEKIKLLHVLADGTRSAGQIATSLHTTRNAVCGYIERHKADGLRLQPVGDYTHKPKRPPRPASAPAYQPNRYVAAKPATKPLPAPRPQRQELVEVGNPKTIFELSHKTCRWPLGDLFEPAKLFCGATPTLGSVYCEKHRRRSLLGGGYV